MTLARYDGTTGQLYMDYADAATGRTLEAVPGGTYDVHPAPGRNPELAAVPGDGRWTIASAAGTEPEPEPEEPAAVPAEDAAPGPLPAPEAEPEPAPESSGDAPEPIIPAGEEAESASPESEE